MITEAAASVLRDMIVDEVARWYNLNVSQSAIDFGSVEEGINSILVQGTITVPASDKSRFFEMEDIALYLSPSSLPSSLLKSLSSLPCSSFLPFLINVKLEVYHEGSKWSRRDSDEDCYVAGDALYPADPAYL